MKTHFTKSQLKINDWVRELGFQTEMERVFGKYCVDIFIPELNWAVEVDGPVGHLKKGDLKRDKYLYLEWKIDNVIHVKNEVGEKELKEKILESIGMKFGKNETEKRS